MPVWKASHVIFLLKYSWFTMLCYFLLMSEQWFSHILYSLLQDIAYSFLCYNSGTLLFIHSVYNSLLLLISTSQPFPSPPSLPWQLQVRSLSLSVLYIGSFGLYFRFHICDIIWCLLLSFWLTSLSRTIPGTTHAAANGIISLSLWVILHSSVDGHLGCFHV